MESLPSTFTFGRAELRDFDGTARREWLVTNGIGGFAAGTVALACTRRYHGLLVAALRPPVERTVLVAKADLAIRYWLRYPRVTGKLNSYRD
jgi:hypothetical protein